ncbi:MAG: hypothetical protein QOH88_492 [Verrucomicrobiota bacterium]|jgi:hypothetical protein
MHFKRNRTGSILSYALISVTIAGISLHAQELVSPDKRWEYQFSAGVGPRLVKAGTSETVLDLSKILASENNGTNTDNRDPKPVWAPDSKRVAFNYWAHEHRSNGFGSTVLFELRDDKWIFLRSPLDSKEVQTAPEAGPNENDRDQLAKLAKKYLRKNTYKAALLRSPSTGDFFRVVRWSSPDTAVFWAFSSDTSMGLLAELRVDRGGDWKLVTAKVLSGKAAEKQEE